MPIQSIHIYPQEPLAAYTKYGLHGKKWSASRVNITHVKLLIITSVTKSIIVFDEPFLWALSACTIAQNNAIIQWVAIFSVNTTDILIFFCI